MSPRSGRMVHIFNHNYESQKGSGVWIPTSAWSNLIAATRQDRLRYIPLFLDGPGLKTFNKTQAAAILEEVNAVAAVVDDPKLLTMLDDLLPIIQWASRYGGSAALMVQQDS